MHMKASFDYDDLIKALADAVAKGLNRPISPDGLTVWNDDGEEIDSFDSIELEFSCAEPSEPSEPEFSESIPGYPDYGNRPVYGAIEGQSA